MNVKEIPKDKLEIIKGETLIIINDIRDDYEMIREYVSRPLSKIIKNSNIELIGTNEALIKMVEKRKDKKYAALTAELASVMEDFLQELYKLSSIDGEKYNTKNKHERISTIQALELSLKGFVDLGDEGNLKLLNALRNKAVREHAFSIKYAKKEENVQRILKERNLQNKKKSKTILLQLILDSEEYVKKTTIN